jgi:hypothetical protein
LKGMTHLNVVNSGGSSNDGPAYHAGENMVGEVGPGVSDLHKTLRQGNSVSVRVIKLAPSPHQKTETEGN